MWKLLKQSRFYIGITLIIQTFSLLILFFTQKGKRKSLSNTFAALSLFCLGVGSLLVVKSANEEKERISVLDTLCGEYIYVDKNGDFKNSDVPVEENVNESEFER